MGKVIQMPEHRHPNGKPCDCEGPRKMDDYDECIMGTVDRFGFDHPVFLYDLSKIIQKLMTRDGMGLESAHEYFEFNMLGAWVGPGTPAFFYQKEDL